MKNGFPDRSIETRPSTIAVISLHTVGMVLCFVIALYMVPRFAAAADAMTNADTAPPVLTQKVLSISAHMQIYWHAYVIILVVLLLLDVFIYRAFNSTSKAGAQI